MPQTAAQDDVVRFGIFEADLRSGELRRNGSKVKLQELPFRALRLLLSRPNEVLSREEFRKALWPDDVFVDFDHGISSGINRLRDALGDSAENPIFVETVERRGYRWIAPIRRLASAAEDPSNTPDEVRVGPRLVEPAAQHATEYSRRTSHRWKWIWVLPVLALLSVAWNFRPSDRAARANTATRMVSAGSASAGSRAAAVHAAANPEAEDFYLKGRFYWSKRTPEDLSKAVDYFTQAIVHDSNYAPAYVGLADCYNLLREYSVMPGSEAYPRALAAARKAVELDDDSSEAHASLAFVSFYGMWDATTAQREFRRAIDLDPKNAAAHHWYATYLMTLRQFPEALEEIERAQALDPTSKSILADRGKILCEAGRRDEGLALLKQMETAEPDFTSPHRYLGSVYLAIGDYPDYLVELKKEALLMHDDSAVALADAGQKGFTTGGAQGMLRSMLPLQKQLFGQGRFSPYFLAETWSLLGNKREALAYLKADFDRHDERFPEVEGDPAFNNLHDEGAYREMVARLGFSARK
jgi:DNA-binding winged helix-turn-helix (wHTH) protein/Tfp pilus assembly protein PilF